MVYYKQTILGPLWYLIQPIFSTIMYMLVFGNLAQIGTDGIPQILFYFSGTMLWTYFSDTLINVSNVFINNKDIFGKVYFPRLAVPIAASIGLIVKLVIQFLLFTIIFFYYFIKGASLQLYCSMLLLPLIVLWIGTLAMGLGLIVSSITTKYRDLAMILGFLISLLMYATPVVYPISEIPQNMKILFYLNPVSAPIEMFRICFFDAGMVPVKVIIWSVMVTLMCLLFGIALFNRNEKRFVDVM